MYAASRIGYGQVFACAPRMDLAFVFRHMADVGEVATMTKLLSRKTSVAWALTALALTTVWCGAPALAAERVVLCEEFTATW